MEKTYEPHGIEKNIYQHWEAKNYFAPNDNKLTYSMVIPPPNVTGSLHMGHGFQHSLMDACVRYNRMCGKATLWQVGSDHAGIATQMVVERQLSKEGLSKEDLGREKFIEKIWDWKAHSGNTITNQMRRLGISVDWSRERFTMDDGLSHAVSTVFEKLYDEGLIYKGTRLVNWDPTLQTAISDLEVINEEVQGSLWHIRYPIVDCDDYIIIATTRPETLLGDTAVAVNPNDERYKNLINKKIKLPLTNRTIPIISDSYVDMDFGSGAVKITPAHDFNDYEVGERHNLEKINILNKDGTLNSNTPEQYQNLDRFDARKQIIKDLDTQGLLEKISDHTLQLPKGDRTGDVIEPYLTEQWYVKTKPLAEPAIEAVKSGEIKFVPENWNKTYFQWLENIEDWCISRQLWWGHRIPAWYDEEKNIYVGQTEELIRKKYNLSSQIKLTQDQDVLDTWFSSALWPFSTLGWPEKTLELEKFYPTDTLITGFDIIFYWVARMVMFGLKFTGKIPFKEVVMTGLIRDAHGHKMSKTKGNVLDPIDLIDGIDLESLIHKRTVGLMQPQMAPKIEEHTREEFPEGVKGYGTDALRFTFCALASTGRDIRFDVGRLEGYRNFCNKIWNASRYVLMNTEEYGCLEKSDKKLNLADKWILSKLQNTIEKSHQYFKSHRFDFLTQCLHEFIWNDYCDWYLELSKPILYSDEFSEAQKNSTRYTLVAVLENILKLLHPIMPFITESIWQTVKPLLDKTGETVMLEPYPELNKSLVDTNSCDELNWVKDFVVGLRTIRAEMNIAPSKTLPVLLKNASELDITRISNNKLFLAKLAKLSQIEILDNTEEAPPSATALVGTMECHIPLAGLIDKEAESARLNKSLEKLMKEITKLQSKLDNPNYIKKAPEPVVQKDRDLLAELVQSQSQLQTQLNKLADL